ncbi:hypothetical protein L873DRAFT_1809003 [Choiromyces venosus 120613-1]|uniref:Uncharacterized protein n=1 Tax=Choiromyces venosus 120613-1 TaxID=1336337 RepID=A0A3N4JLN3_9PEZI|nr:hypothetical protein L873DRAFT_1809003 [Choiromyces venosus 120613-1]
MDFNPHASSYSYFNNGNASGSSSHRQSSGPSSSSGRETDGAFGGFDVIAWYPKHQSCQRYFVEVAQHSYPCQALAAFINIKLPFQRMAGSSNLSTGPTPVRLPPPFRPHGAFHPPPHPLAQTQPHHPTMSSYGWVSLYPYIRRLVATGLDAPAILHGWFGDDWECGVGPQHEQERRNFLFMAKSGGWATVKQDYDMVADECIPYIQPLRKICEGELEGAEETWSGWLAMEDWMLGKRAPLTARRGSEL